MPTATTTVTTDKASRYLIAVCRHASRIDHRILARHGHRHGGGRERPEVRHVDWSDSEGTIELSWGRCVLRAGAGELAVTIEADDDERLGQIEGVITRDLERYGRREHLAVEWVRQA